jgi:hypothetical protein
MVWRVLDGEGVYSGNGTASSSKKAVGEDGGLDGGENGFVMSLRAELSEDESGEMERWRFKVYWGSGIEVESRLVERNSHNGAAGSLTIKSWLIDSTSSQTVMPRESLVIENPQYPCPWT